VEFGWSEAEIAFRDDLRAFLEAELPEWWGPDSRRRLEEPEHAELCFSFVAKLAERGWLTPHWPAEFGGSDTPPWLHFILGEEMWSRNEPRGPQYMNVNWIGPAIMRFGTPEQKAYHLARISAGDVLWCQGFSEPDAGSDLAALQTKAVLDGDEYVVNGSKIWTSYANAAEFCFLLVRTAPDKHNGITILLVPMDTTGLEIRHIDSVVGAHVFHELFFTDMRVPTACRLGPENEGWSIVREALTYERVGSPRYASAALVLDALAERCRRDGRLTAPSVQERLGAARAVCEAARLLTYRVIDERAKGLPPSPNVYVARVAMVRAERVVGELAMELIGPDGLVAGSDGDTQYRNLLMAGVAAGTYEVQLNLIARMVLGLPAVK
jgi:alkylation response protein AidB-like acyl-CoA dehydrogenase